MHPSHGFYRLIRWGMLALGLLQNIHLRSSATRTVRRTA